MLLRNFSTNRSPFRLSNAPRATRTTTPRRIGHIRLKRYIHTNKEFDYNENYFKGTKVRLETDAETGNRGLFAAQNLRENELLFVTPYYSHIIHASLQSQFCNACHDSFEFSGVANSTWRSRFIKAHLYCSEACLHRGEPIDEEMAPSLKMIQKRDPDFYVANTDNIKSVLFTLARKSLERKRSKAPLVARVEEPITDENEDDVKERCMNVLKRDSLLFEDVERLCTLDVSPFNHFLSPKLKQSLIDTDERMRLLLYDSPLMMLDTTPLDILTRDASNSFSVDKYDSHSGLTSSRSRPEASGFAMYPLASYFNHSCQPNCVFAFDLEANIAIRTLERVGEGEELTICYNPDGVTSPVKDIQSDKNRMHRCKKMCREVWGFECDCV